MLLVLLLLLLLIRITCPVEHHGEIIEVLRKQRNIGRVYLVYNDMLGNTAVHLSKILAKKNIAAGLLKVINLQEDTIDELPSPSLFVMLIADNTMRSFLLKISQNPQTMLANTWLLLGDFNVSDDHISLMEFLEGMPIPLNCDFFVTEETNGEVVLVKGVSHFKHRVFSRIRHFGTWYRNQAKWVSNVFFEVNRANLEGLKMKTAYIESALFSLTPPRGYFGTIWEILETALNFTSDYMLVNDVDSVLEVDNRSWTGVMGLLQRNEVWASGSHVEMSSHRAEVVTFLDPLLIAKKHVFIRVRKKPRGRAHWKYISRPFTVSLWNTIGVALLTFAATLFSTGQFASEPRPYTISDSLLVALASLCGQGIEETPTYWSSRLVFITAFMTGYVILAGYSAAVISDLATVTTTLPFVDFKGMLEHGKYRLGMTVSSPIYDELLTTEDPIMTRVMHELLAPRSQLPHTETEGLELACKRKHYAFLADEMDWKMGVHNLSCEVMPIPNAYVPVSLAMALKKKIDVRGIFNYIYRKLGQAGILRIVHQRTLPKKRITEEVHDLTVSIREVVPVLCILLFGIGIAVILLILEILSAESKVWTTNSNMRRTKAYPPRKHHNKVFYFGPYKVRRLSF